VTVESLCSLDSTSRGVRSDGDLGWIWQDVTQFASHFGIPDAVRDACNAGGKWRRGKQPPTPASSGASVSGLKLLVYDLGVSSGGQVSKDALDMLRSKLDETLSYYCMRPEATNACGLKLLMHAALSY
jgi:hypothetical protein